MLAGLLLQLTNPVADTAKKIIQDVVETIPAPMKSISPIEFIVKGGWIMVPLGILFLLTLYFAIERLIVISKAGRTDRSFIPNIRDYLRNGRIDSAVELCKAKNTPESRVIGKGLSRLGKPSREIEVAMEGTGRLELAHAERNLHILSLIAKTAPMLGFVGTIIGVVNIFYRISQSKDISLDTIAEGLYEKMVTSGTGLAVGIVAFICYHLLNRMIDRMANRIERSSLQFLDMIHEPTV
jgi:biopolymer transport protein ExbB